MKDILPSEVRIVVYNSKPVPISAIMDIPEKFKDRHKALYATVKEEDSPHLERDARETKIPTRPEGVILVVTAARGLVQIGLQLKSNKTQACTSFSGIIGTFPNRLSHDIVFNPTNATYFMANQQFISTVFLPPS